MDHGCSRVIWAVSSPGSERWRAQAPVFSTGKLGVRSAPSLISPLYKNYSQLGSFIVIQTRPFQIHHTLAN